MSLALRLSCRIHEDRLRQRALHQLPPHVHALRRTIMPDTTRQEALQQERQFNRLWLTGLALLLFGSLPLLSHIKSTGEVPLEALNTRSFGFFMVLVLVLSLGAIIWAIQTLVDIFSGGRPRIEQGWSLSEVGEFLRRVRLQVRRRIRAIENVYLEMKNLSTLLNQLVFFSLCERLLIPHQHLASLYTLLFCNVVTYCVAYIKEIIEREDWSMYVTIAEGSNVRHLAMSATKIVLEWTKAITFTVTVVFMLLFFGLEKGLENYKPSIEYLLLTSFYYMTTEKVYVELCLLIMEKVKWDRFENMESMYCPIILKSIQLAFSCGITVFALGFGYLRLSVIALFTNIRIKFREVRDKHWEALQRELSVLAEYRVATRKELQERDDVCAICLTYLSSARVTPCNHFFHADCLRRCLRQTNKCPICQHRI